MTDIRPQIAAPIRLAQHGHTQAFPAGDWRGVNDRLGSLRLIAIDIDPTTCGLGNAECAAHLQMEWALENE